MTMPLPTPEPVDDGGAHPVLPWLTQRRRAWLYRVTWPVSALAGAYGLVADETAPLWVAVVLAVVSPGVAAAHTPTT